MSVTIYGAHLHGYDRNVLLKNDHIRCLMFIVYPQTHKNDATKDATLYFEYLIVNFKKASASAKLNMRLSVYSVLCTSHCDGGKKRNDNYTMQQNLSMANGHTHKAYYSFLNKHRKISHSCHARNVVALRFQSIRK